MNVTCASLHQSKSTCVYYINSHTQHTIPVLTKSERPKRELHKLATAVDLPYQLNFHLNWCFILWKILLDALEHTKGCKLIKSYKQ